MVDGSASAVDEEIQRREFTSTGTRYRKALVFEPLTGWMHDEEKRSVFFFTYCSNKHYNCNGSRSEGSKRPLPWTAEGQNCNGSTLEWLKIRGVQEAPPLERENNQSSGT